MACVVPALGAGQFADTAHVATYALVLSVGDTYGLKATNPGALGLVLTFTATVEAATGLTARGDTMPMPTTFEVYLDGVSVGADAILIVVPAGAIGTFFDSTHTLYVAPGQAYSLVAVETGVGALTCTASLESATN
jgi:hypothetical protein